MKHELSKRVQAAMGREPVAGPHPSADELNAYAEQSLTAREREHVASHLATCADCRDVLMVSDRAQEPEPLQAGGVSASAPRWHAWRWVVAAALVPVIAAAVWLARPRQKKDAPVTVAQNQGRVTGPTRLPEASAQNSQRASAAGPASSSASDETSGVSAAKTDASRRKRGTSAKDEPIEIATNHPPATPVSAPRAGAASKPSAPTHVDTAERSAASDAAMAKVAPAANSFNAAPVTAAAQATQTVEVTAASPAAETSGAPAAKGGVAAGLITQNARSYAPAMRRTLRDADASAWRISQEGQLEHRTGDTWAVVALPNRNRLTTLAVMGQDIWLGDLDGFLVHSADNGQSWTTVQLVPAASAIRSIQFNDRLHGIVVDAGGSEWTTADGGRTWALR